MSRHRQRLFLREELLSDDYTFTCASGPLVVQLVILPFVPHDPVVTSELNFAAAQNREMTVEAMLQLPVDPNQGDFDGVTPLCAAAKAGAAMPVWLLLEAMADTEQVSERQQTPLHLAIQSGRDDVMKLLLEADASTDHKDVHGNTALHVAASNNFCRPVALLLDRRAAVNSSNQWGQTPLFLAAEEDEVIICRLLLEARADMRAQDCYGDTPLHVSLRAACCDTAALLLEFRASPAIINNAGHDALRIARASDDEAMHRLFFYWSWSTLCPTPFVCVFSDRPKPCFTSVCVSSDRTEPLQLSAVACDSSVRAGHRRYCSAMRAKEWCGLVQVTVDTDTRVTMTVFSFHQVTCGDYWYSQCVDTLPNVLLEQNGSMSIYPKDLLAKKKNGLSMPLPFVNDHSKYTCLSCGRPETPEKVARVFLLVHQGRV